MATLFSIIRDVLTLLALGLVAIVVAIAAIIAVNALYQRRQRRRRPRLTAHELRAMQDRLAADRLPGLRLTLTPGPTPAPASRIGGPPWAPPEGADWPTGHKGRPVPFLAQLNFADLPRLPDFPDSGLLQIFAGNDNRNLILRFHDRPKGDGHLPIPDAFRRRPGRWWHNFTPQALETGLALRAEPFLSLATHEAPAHVDIHLAIDGRLPADDEAAEILKGWSDRMEAIRDGYPPHRIGGHGDWTSDDFLPEFDRVILHLQAHEGMVEASEHASITLMIPADDLRARRWDRAQIHIIID
jgi:type II secretory pathway pseudopilin PulG